MTLEELVKSFRAFNKKSIGLVDSTITSDAKRYVTNKWIFKLGSFYELEDPEEDGLSPLLIGFRRLNDKKTYDYILVFASLLEDSYVFVSLSMFRSEQPNYFDDYIPHRFKLDKGVVKEVMELSDFFLNLREPDRLFNLYMERWKNKWKDNDLKLFE